MKNEELFINYSTLPLENQALLFLFRKPQVPIESRSLRLFYFWLQIKISRIIVKDFSCLILTQRIDDQQKILMGEWFIYPS